MRARQIPIVALLLVFLTTGVSQAQTPRTTFKPSDQQMIARLLLTHERNRIETQTTPRICHSTYMISNSLFVDFRCAPHNGLANFTIRDDMTTTFHYVLGETVDSQDARGLLEYVYDELVDFRLLNSRGGMLLDYLFWLERDGELLGWFAPHLFGNHGFYTQAALTPEEEEITKPLPINATRARSRRLDTERFYVMYSHVVEAVRTFEAEKNRYNFTRAHHKLTQLEPLFDNLLATSATRDDLFDFLEGSLQSAIVAKQDEMTEQFREQLDSSD